jgi:signal transduction histidine kinase
METNPGTSDGFQMRSLATTLFSAATPSTIRLMGTSTSGAGTSLQEGSGLGAFAEFIRANRDEIIRHWVTAVDRSPQVQASEDLTFSQLVDHLPQLCNDLADALTPTQRNGANVELAQHSTAHGRWRWQQGYRVEELIRELSIIRRDFVVKWFYLFEEQKGSLSRERRHQALQIVHQFFDEIIFGSVVQFVEEKEESVQKSQVALRAAKKEAEAAERAKNDFVDLVSHDLRTPLTPILLTASALAEDQSLPAEIREFVLLVQQNSLIEAGLIDDLLDASRLTRAGLVLDLSEVDVHACLSGAATRCGPEFDAKLITPTLRLVAQSSLVRGDERRLKRAFMTLMRNAINVSAPASTVTVTTRNNGEQIEVAVEDSGPALDGEALRRLFLPFEEGRRSAFGLGGLGVSRYVCKAIIEAHQGAISARPREGDRGAILTVTLPLNAR